MRILCMACVLVFSCSKSNEAADESAAATEEAPGTKDDSPKKAAPSKNSPVAKKAETNKLECANLIATDLVNATCGNHVPLAPKQQFGKMNCRYEAKTESRNRVMVSITKTYADSWVSTKRRFPVEPKFEARGIRQHIRTSAYPFTIEVTQLRGKEPLECSKEQLFEITKKIRESLPTESEPETGENKACDALLTKEDMVQTCGGGKGVFATRFENGKDIYCHRTGPGAMIFIVTKHPDGTVAKAGEGVASGYEGAVSLAEGQYVIEIKSKSGGLGGAAACTKPQLTSLAKKVAERLR